MDDRTKEAVYLFHELVRIQRHKDLLRQQLSEIVRTLAGDEFDVYVKLTIDKHMQEGVVTNE